MLQIISGEDKDSTDIPLDLLDSVEIWNQVLSHHTWSHLLSDSEREQLSSLLPDIPPDEQRDNLKQLFGRKEFRFGTTPLTQAYYTLKQLIPHCKDWICLEARNSAKRQHHMMSQLYSQIVAGLCDSRKRSHSLDGLDNDRKKLYKIQNELWRTDRITYDTDKAKRDRVKTLLHTRVPPLPHGTTHRDIESKIRDIMHRHNYQPPVDRTHTQPLPLLIKNRPRIKVSKLKLKPALKKTKISKTSHTHPLSRHAPSPDDLSFSPSLLITCSPPCFFILIKQLFYHSPHLKLTLERLEKEVTLWIERQLSDSASDWVDERDDWSDLSQSAVCYLAIETGAYSVMHTPAGFYPLMELKDRTGQWEWIGQGRDQDNRLIIWCRGWFNNMDKSRDSVLDYSYKPPRSPIYSSVNPVSIPTPQDVVLSFRQQETLRYQNPHRSYTYSLNNNRCVVAPVKGVVSRERAGFKVREHTLLDSSRPPCVTILTLVRDAVARLENGEGTRQDICQLVQDSQYINSSASESHINAAVSGALDRLHYEKDPCVRFENSLKLWVYLHRYRTEQLFNEIHHLQIVAINVRKKLLNQLEKDRNTKQTPVIIRFSPINDQEDMSSHPEDPSSRVSSHSDVSTDDVTSPGAVSDTDSD
ncbi:Nuclear factor related to kappa-B-binding protein-like [Oopsacas minuta]|uniref:Nuclear factor related to kappa-B-binding protein-like n=1 Tax=Oopsacas minuta TaxID=111878 RepID=A0AAV7K5F4_9METZ|nr:Nuclear factor related to kappa-B-binding protein-like [Oopsacas minuta]